MSQIDTTLAELARILRPGGYLILREHDCKNDFSLSVKYLNFIHAIMMIARVGEFADTPGNYNTEETPTLNENRENNTTNWTQQKSSILNYIQTIHYHTYDEWQKQLESVGFRLLATLHYGADSSRNPQKLFYAVYQLNTK